MTDLVRDIDERFQALERTSTRYRQGTVATASPLTIYLGGSTTAVAAASIAPAATLAVGNVVACIAFGNDLLVLGVVGGAPAVPPGTLAATARSTAPTGWLICDGSNVSRTTYANLFAAISTNFGSGDGSTTFGLPDLKGRVPVGVDGSPSRLNGAHAETLAGSGGADFITLTIAEMPSHAHAAHGFYVTTGGTAANALRFDGPNADVGGVENTGGGGAHDNMPPYLVVNWMVKT